MVAADAVHVLCSTCTSRMCVYTYTHTLSLSFSFSHTHRLRHICGKCYQPSSTYTSRICIYTHSLALSLSLSHRSQHDRGKCCQLCGTYTSKICVYTHSHARARALSLTLSLTHAQISIWSRQMLSAMQHIHRKNVIHCDVKSCNILLISDDSGICIFMRHVTRVNESYRNTHK